MNSPRYSGPLVLDEDVLQLLNRHFALFDSLVEGIERDFPAGRARSLVLTKLDEAVFWLALTAKE